MKPFKIFLIALGVSSFLSCSSGYRNSGDAVYYEYWNEGSGQQKTKLDADPKTFTIFTFDAYAKDAQSVFYEGRKIAGADALTFEALGDFYARDKNYGWYGNDTIQNSHGPSFRVVNDYYSTDGYDYFYTNLPLHMANPAGFAFISGKGESECWVTDGLYYYYKNYKVPSDDYSHVKIYPGSGGLSSDRNWAYFLDHKLNYDIEGNRVVDTIDMATFTVTGYITCHDKYGREKCNE